MELEKIHVDNLVLETEIYKLLSNNAAIKELDSAKFMQVDFQQQLAQIKIFISGERIHHLGNRWFQLESQR